MFGNIKSLTEFYRSSFALGNIIKRVDEELATWQVLSRKKADKLTISIKHDKEFIKSLIKDLELQLQCGTEITKELQQRIKAEVGKGLQGAILCGLYVYVDASRDDMDFIFSGSDIKELIDV